MKIRNEDYEVPKVKIIISKIYEISLTAQRYGYTRGLQEEGYEGVLYDEIW